MKTADEDGRWRMEEDEGEEYGGCRRIKGEDDGGGRRSWKGEDRGGGRRV